MQIEFALGQTPDAETRMVEFIGQAENRWIFCRISFETLAACFGAEGADDQNSPAPSAERAFQANRAAIETIARGLIESGEAGENEEFDLTAVAVTRFRAV